MPSTDQPAILVVESDLAAAQLQRRRLEAAGYAVTLSADAADALQQLKIRPPQLLVVSDRLPGNRDCLGFIKSVKAAGYDLPVILVADFRNEPAIIQALRSGVRECLGRSREFADYLPEVVERVLKQVRTENQLAEAEARLASLLNSAKDAILISGADQRITFFNPAAERMFRCTAAEAIGQPSRRFIPMEYVPIDGAPDTDSGYTIQVRSGAHGVRTDGEQFPVEAAASRGQAGGQKFHMVIVRDITQRQRDEQALRDSEERFRSLVETAGVVIVTLGPDRIIREWNREAERVFGWPRGEVLGKDYFQLCLEEGNQPAIAADFAKVLAGQPTRDYENRVRIRGGGKRILAWNVTATHDAAGQPREAIAIGLDITERKLTEEALRLRDRALSAFTQGVVITNPALPDNPIIYVNQGFERLTGYQRGDVLGRNCRFLHGPDTDDVATAAVEQAFRDRQPCLVQLLHYRKDGSPFWNAQSIAPVLNAAGQLTHFVTVLTDVTEFKLLEAQLQQTQKMEAVGHLAGGVSHEFNNLLTIITGFSDVILMGLSANDPTRAMLTEVSKAAERAVALTRQLLALSRRQVLAPQVLSLNQVVHDAEGMLQPLLGDRIDLRLNLAREPARIKADRSQMEQVILNLVVNARDAMPQSGQLIIETHTTELDIAYARKHANVKPGSFVKLKVTDTGCGMDEATLAHIFEPFFTTKGIGKGTGLGLSTVYGIVQQSGGHIEVQSKPNQGTTFAIYLPRIAEAPTADKEAGVSPDARETQAGTILLAEDDDGVRFVIRMALQARGYTVMEARDGKDALRASAEHKGTIDLLITDVVMPNSGGRELAEELTRQRPAMKVLYITGHAEDAMIRDGLLEAGQPLLHKPISQVVLARKVRELLDPKVTG